MVVAAPCQHLGVVGRPFSMACPFSFGNLRAALFRAPISVSEAVDREHIRVGPVGSTPPRLALGPRPPTHPLGLFDANSGAQPVRHERHAPEGGFVDAMQAVIEGMLQSPHFLYHLEFASPGMPFPADAVLPAPAFALASRLSFFLWSSGRTMRFCARSRAACSRRG